MNRLTPLAITFTVLLGLVAWRETTRGSTRTLTEEANLKPLQVRPFTADDASRIEVTAPGADKPTYGVQRKEMSWRVTAPFEAPASGANVTKLLDALAKAEGEFRADDDSSLEQFDLTRARAVDLRVFDKEEKELIHLAVGRTSGQKGAFVRNLASNGDASKAYSLTADLRSLLGLSRTSVGDREPDKPEAGHFHDKEFPQLKLGKAKSVELVAPGRRLVAEMVKKDEKDPQGEWKVVEGGFDASLRKDVVDKAVGTLTGGFHPTGLIDPGKRKELGFDAPKYRLAVTSEDGTKRAAVGNSDATAAHWYVRLDSDRQDPDVLFEASEYEFHQMFPQGSTLFDLPKLEQPKDGIAQFVLRRGGADANDLVELSRKGTKPADDWEIRTPAWPLAPKQQALRSMTGSLNSVRAIDYTDDLTPFIPDFVIGFQAVPPQPAGDEAPNSSLVIGPKAASGKGRLARLPSARDRTVVIDDSAVERLTPTTLSLFEPKVLHGWKREDVTAVREKTPGAVAIVRDGDGWSIEDASGTKTKASTSAVEAWLDRLLAVGATGVLTDVKQIDATTLTVERKEGTPIEMGVAATQDGKRVVVLGTMTFSVDDAADLRPDRAALADKAPPKEEEPKEEAPKDDGEEK